METQKTRAVVASGCPEAQNLLDDLIERNGDAVTVGRATNVSEALVLARKISPDIVIVDCYLPYKVGTGDLRMSRMGGLDTAQAISEELAGTKVVLLNNLDTLSRQGHSYPGGNGKVYSIRSQGTDVSFALPDIRRESNRPNEPVFAFIEAKQQTHLTRMKMSLWDRVTLFGVLAVAGGWFLTLTVMFAQAGIILATAGAVMLLLGFLGKKFTSRWRLRRQ